MGDAKKLIDKPITPGLSLFGMCRFIPGCLWGIAVDIYSELQDVGTGSTALTALKSLVILPYQTDLYFQSRYGVYERWQLTVWISAAFSNVRH